MGFLLVYFYKPNDSAKSNNVANSNTKELNQDVEIIRKAILGSSEVKPTLMSWAKDPIHYKRERAAAYLSKYSESDVLPVLLQLAQDTRIEVRARAYLSLSQRKDIPYGRAIAFLLSDSSKTPKDEKLLLRLYTANPQSKTLAKDLEAAILLVGYRAKEETPHLGRYFLQALKNIPKGQKMLLSHYESGDPKKVTVANAALTANGVSLMCPKNRFDYLNSISTMIKNLKAPDQTRVLSEFRRHGEKGAKLIQAAISKDNRLPAGYITMTQNYLNKKDFKDMCPK